MISLLSVCHVRYLYMLRNAELKAKMCNDVLQEHTGNRASS